MYNTTTPFGKRKIWKCYLFCYLFVTFFVTFFGFVDERTDAPVWPLLGRRESTGTDRRGGPAWRPGVAAFGTGPARQWKPRCRHRCHRSREAAPRRALECSSVSGNFEPVFRRSSKCQYSRIVFWSEVVWLRHSDRGLCQISSV